VADAAALRLHRLYAFFPTATWYRTTIQNNRADSGRTALPWRPFFCTPLYYGQ
jgi:hypothetical protein